MQKVVRNLMEPMLKDNIISPASSSDITSPIVLVKKKNGEWRFCVDFRQLNERLIPDHYPLPLIRDVHDSLRGASVFSTFDLKSGFWQIPLHENDKHKTTFVIPGGTYEFNVMPFGLSTAPSLFQRAMDTVLNDVKFEFALAYIDDVIVYSHSFSDHLMHVDAILHLLQEHKMKVGLPKCNFAVK
jgi:hypothetical protein